jgi:hypothetical protein
MGAAADSSLAQVSLEGLSSVARRRRSANGSATQAADDGACEGIAGRSTNQRTTTGADSTAGQRALPWGVSAGGGRQRQCGADRKICDSRHEQLLVPIPRYNEEEHVHRQKSGVQTVTVPGNFASASRQVSPHVINPNSKCEPLHFPPVVARRANAVKDELVRDGVPARRPLQVSRLPQGCGLAHPRPGLAADLRRGGYFNRRRPASVRLTECKPPEMMSQSLSIA